MAINVTLTYNDNLGYGELYPKTNVKSIKKNRSALKYSTRTVIIPYSGVGLEQSIYLGTTTEQDNAPFMVELTSQGVQAEYSFSTISQVKIENSYLIITRLGNKPTQDINVKITFKEGEE